jgi:Spy/CpxP family protein refolding chaperone
MMGGYGSGWGMGPGMMGGYGPGWGRGDGMMRGYGALSTLNLTAEQRKKIEEIQESTRKEQWEITGKMLGESDKLRDLLAADPMDRAATDAQYERLQALRKQRFDIALESRKKVMDALTAEQRERMRHYGPWWMQGGGD